MLGSAHSTLFWLPRWWLFSNILTLFLILRCCQLHSGYLGEEAGQRSSGSTIRDILSGAFFFLNIWESELPGRTMLWACYRVVKEGPLGSEACKKGKPMNPRWELVGHKARVLVVHWMSKNPVLGRLLLYKKGLWLSLSIIFLAPFILFQ